MHPQVPDRQGSGYAFTLTAGPTLCPVFTLQRRNRKPSSLTSLGRGLMAQKIKEDGSSFCFNGASLVTQMVKSLPAMRETWVQSLGREDPLEKEMATHSTTLAWEIPWMEEPDRLQSMGSQTVGHD